MVVVSAGIRPITEIAMASGLTVNRAIVCDDQMRTSDPASSRLENASSIAARLTGSSIRSGNRQTFWQTSSPAAKPDAAYHGSKLGTKLKVMGVELASMGATKPAGDDDEVVVYREPARGIYKKLIVRGGQIAGAILLGDIEAAGTLMQMFLAGIPAPARRADLLFGSPSGVALLKASDLPDNAQICNCNGVSKQQIVDAIQARGCQSVSKVGACTKAGTGLRLLQEPRRATPGSLPRRSRLRSDRALLRSRRAAREVTARLRNPKSRHQVRQRSVRAAGRRKGRSRQQSRPRLPC